MAVRPESSSAGQPSARASAWLSVLFGLAALATLAAAIAAAEIEGYLDVAETWIALPPAAVLALVAIALGRRARSRARAALAPVRGRRPARLGRLLGYLALYLTATAALAFGVYALLNYLE